MDHSQRSSNPESSNGSSASSSLMPNVLFREIHKNAFLKRHSSDRRTGFPRKSEKVWVVFCVHDDVEPFLEIYPDQKVALTHKPEWFASLSSALHVSPTICGHEDEFEFAVTLSFQVVRLAAPSWESMMEWVETIRNKLRELKVLCPKENLYSKMPEPKQPLLPTRDPNSPLPLPPEGPSTLLPGVELVHIENRNGPSHSDANHNGRNQRDVSSRNNVVERRVSRRRENLPEREARSHIDTSQLNESSSNSDFPNEINQGMNVSDVVTTSVNLNSENQPNKPRVKRATSVPQPEPSTSHIPSGSNVTVIEVSTPSNREKFFKSKCNPVLSFDSSSDSEYVDDEFCNSLVQKTHKTNSNISNNDNSDETHYDHVFPSNPSQQPQCSNIQPKSNCGDVNKHKKTHLTSVIISPNSSNVINSSHADNTTAAVGSSSSGNTKDILVGNSTCVNFSRDANVNETDDDNPLSPHTQSKLEKVNISGLIPRVPAKTSKVGISKPLNVTPRDSNLNILEGRKSPVQSGGHCSQNSPSNVEEQDVHAVIEVGESSKANGAIGFSPPAYSQVKKSHKIKVKSEDLPKEEPHSSQMSSSPVFPKRKQHEIPIPEVPVEHRRGNKRHENQSNSDVNPSPVALVGSKPSNKIIPSQKEVSRKKHELVNNINISRDIIARHPERNQSVSIITNNDNRDETSSSTPSTSGNRVDNSTRVNIVKKESNANSNNNPEVEPIVATVQPAIGVINVEDIPLIGGHQRRRRRSSSSDSTPCANVPSSRGIGGADRIRINVPLTSNPATTRDVQRKDNEARSSSHSRNGGEQNSHVPQQSSRLTLREQQVLQLRKEMMHPGGVRLQLRKKDCLGSIALVDVLNGVWIAGWKQKEHPLLYNALHIGDQLISVGDVLVRSSVEAQKLIRSSNNMYIEFIIRRVPFGNVFTLQRTAEGQNLGIVQEGNTAEIKDVIPNSIAARQGLTPKTQSADKLSLTTWFLTEINARPLNLFFKDNEVRDRLNAVGKEISILVQPHDFIKQIKKQLKNMRGYKEYIVQ